MGFYSNSVETGPFRTRLNFQLIFAILLAPVCLDKLRCLTSLHQCYSLKNHRACAKYGRNHLKDFSILCLTSMISHLLFRNHFICSNFIYNILNYITQVISHIWIISHITIIPLPLPLLLNSSSGSP